MRTIGAKVEDELYSSCCEITDALDVSRSDYVRIALTFFNGCFKNAVEKGRLTIISKTGIIKMQEPTAEGQTEAFEQNTSKKDQNFDLGEEKGPNSLF
jgi:hypothetical protein